MKLSQAGKLYLKEYYILNEAHKDVVDFLNQIQRTIYDNIIERKKEIPITDGFEWKIWMSKASPGYLELWPEPNKDYSMFQKGKNEINIACRDVRHDTNLDTTASVSLTIRCTNAFKRKINNFEESIVSSATAAASKYEVKLDFRQRYNFRTQVSINLEDALESAKSITDAIINCCMAMNDFIGVLIKQGEIDSAKG